MGQFCSRGCVKIYDMAPIMRGLLQWIGGVDRGVFIERSTCRRWRWSILGDVRGDDLLYSGAGNYAVLFDIIVQRRAAVE